MADAATYGIELGVGVATLALSVVCWRSGGLMRGVAVVLAAAGVAAIVHAGTRLV